MNTTTSDTPTNTYKNIYKYEAFISYRHTPKDTQAAVFTQRHLEHYRIPKDIQEKTGIKKFKKLFRDTTELAGSNDLTSEIQEALAGSRFLIVICSPKMKESVWVQREINLFLKTHSYNDILTVITEGEPFDVLPDVLKKGTREITDENGRIIKTIIETEPLSADYRKGRWIYFSEELPRIAARFLNCSYDDLVRRERTYRRRRNIAIASSVSLAAIIIISYLLWSNHQILTAHRESLRQNTLNTATLAENLRSQGRESEALRLVCESAGSLSEKEYRLAPELFRQLEESLDVYDADYRNDYSTLDNIRLLQADSRIRAAVQSADGRFICAVDADNTVYIWDTSTAQCTCSYTPDAAADLPQLAPADNASFLLTSEKEAVLLESGIEEPVWKQSCSSTVLGSSARADGTLCLICRNGLMILDRDSGQILQEVSYGEISKNFPANITLPASETEDMAYNNNGFPEIISVSAGGRYIVVQYAVPNMSTAFALIDTEELTFTYLLTEGVLYSAGWTYRVLDDGSVLRSITEPAGESFELYDSKGALRWKAAQDAPIPSLAPSAGDSTYIDNRNAILSQDGKNIAAVYDNMFLIFDAADGKILSAGTMPSTVRGLALYGPEFLCFSDQCLAVMGGGDDSGSYAAGPTDFSKALILSEKAEEGTSLLLGYIRNDSILLYGYKEANEDIRYLDSDPDALQGMTLTDSCMAGSLLLRICESADKGEGIMSLSDISSDTVLWSVPLPGPGASVLSMTESAAAAGTGQKDTNSAVDDGYLYIRTRPSDGQDLLYRVSMETGEAETIAYTGEAPEGIVEQTQILGMQDQKVYYCTKRTIQFKAYTDLGVYDIETGDHVRYEAPMENPNLTSASLLENGQVLLILDRKDSNGLPSSVPYLCSPETDNWLEMDPLTEHCSEGDRFRTVQDPKRNRIYVYNTAHNRVWIYQSGDTDGSLIGTLTRPGDPIAQVSLYEDSILAVCDSGDLYIYGADDQRILDSVHLPSSEPLSADSITITAYDDSNILIRDSRSGYMVNTDYWSLRSVIPGLIGYDPVSSCFITEAWESGPAAIIPAYTESGLLRKAGSQEPQNEEP